MDLVIGECSIWCNDIILYIYKRKLNRWTISLPTYILQRPSTEEKESYHFQTLHISYFPKVAADDVEKSTKKIWGGSSSDTDTIFMSLIEHAIFQLTFVTLFLHHNFNNNIRIPTPDECVSCCQYYKRPGVLNNFICAGNNKLLLEALHVVMNHNTHRLLDAMNPCLRK